MKKKPLSHRFNSFSIKSLNFVNRKRQAQRILWENDKIGQRLANKKPQIPIESFKKDYKLYLQFKKRISRANILANRKSPSVKTISKDFSNEDNQISASPRPKTPKKFISPCLRDSRLKETKNITDDSSSQ